MMKKTWLGIVTGAALLAAGAQAAAASQFDLDYPDWPPIGPTQPMPPQPIVIANGGSCSVTVTCGGGSGGGQCSVTISCELSSKARETEVMSA